VSDCTELKARIVRMFVEDLGVEAPAPETDLIRTGLLDSLKFVDLLLNLEQRFGAHIDLNKLELDHLRTVDQIARLVARNMNNGDGVP
jgi:methoxymalonate biosynthesis acyl carrier protein